VKTTVRLFLLLLAAPASSQTPPSIEPGIDALIKQPFVRMTGDILEYELVPAFTGTYKGTPFRTNRWGMWDREYALKPPPRTFRIALVGASFSMGAGVAQDRTHESLIENRLNRERPGSYAGYEILNFSVGGYTVIQQVAVVEKKVFAFSPNAVILVIHALERGRTLGNLAALVRAGVPIDNPLLRRKLLEAGVNRRMQIPEIRRKLGPVADDIARLSYKHIANLCRAKGVRLVAIAFPLPRDDPKAELLTASQFAWEAGIPVLSLEGVYEGHPLKSLWLSDRDFHLNPLGHRLIADRLYELLRSNDGQALKLGFSRRQ
jgi:hypothetical protein